MIFTGKPTRPAKPRGRRTRRVSLHQLERIAFDNRVLIEADGAFWRLSQPIDGVTFYADREVAS